MDRIDCCYYNANAPTEDKCSVMNCADCTDKCNFMETEEQKQNRLKKAELHRHARFQKYGYELREFVLRDNNGKKNKCIGTGTFHLVFPEVKS